MWKTYLKITLRNFKSNKGYVLLNILGLSIGLTATILIFVYTNNELTFDTYHTNSQNIFRVAHTRNFDGSINEMSTTPLYLAPIMNQDISGIKNSVRFLRESYGLIEHNNKLYSEPELAYADSSVFEMFDFEFLYGNKGALKKKGAMAISDVTAQKYFGNRNPLGEILVQKVYGAEYSYTVTAVYALPEKSHFRFEILVPFESPDNPWKGMHGKDWFLSQAWTYVELESNSQEQLTNENLAQLVSNHLPEMLKNGTKFYLQPLEEIYLHSHLQGEIATNGRYDYVIILLTIGIVILIIASINFTNLSTAKALIRAKEVALRKTFGGLRKELMVQFFIEASFYVLISLVVAIILSLLLLPLFGSISGAKYEYPDLLSGSVGAYIVVAFFLIIILSGLYPAYYLSGFEPMESLRNAKVKGGGFLLRKVLVVIQFAAVVVCLSGIFMVSNQLRFMKNKDLGFDAEEIIYLNGYDWRSGGPVKQEALALGGITEVAMSTSIPGSQNASMLQTFIRMEGRQDNNRIEAFQSRIDENFFNLMEMEIVEGRGFKLNEERDTLPSVVINETAASLFDNPDDVLGRKIEMFDFLGNSRGMVNVIGVVRDFHIESLQNSIKPLIFSQLRDGPNLLLKAATKDIDQLRSDLISIATKYPAETEAEVYFLNDELQSQYKLEERLFNTAMLFTIVGIAIAMLGLIGLTSFAAQQRLGEMSIRKVFGAGFINILVAFSINILVLFSISAVSGAIISYTLTTEWLSQYAYKVDISISSFIEAGLIVFLLIFLIVCVNVIKLSRANPTVILREN